MNVGSRNVNGVYGPEPPWQAEMVDDGDFTSSFLDAHGWGDAVAASGTVTIGTELTSVDGAHPGTRDFNLSMVTANSVAAYRQAQSSIVLGAVGLLEFEYLVNMVEAPDIAGENYNLLLGFTNTSTFGAASSGFGFLLDTAVSTTNWLRGTFDAADTIEDTGIAFAADTWVNLRAVKNQAGTLVSYFIDGVNAGTIATNIELVTDTGAQIAIRRVAGAAGVTRKLSFDYFRIHQTFVPPRAV